ncbi:MAG: LemA family protein [Methanobacteriaceae archaeon]|jgi:LemA protein|uniref:LemA family protein n=1 Tax=Methanobrevibacter TaxID=2172 RepID=UPI00375B3052|nr:LemA family protein [Methanobacteriaceae archaeon]MDD4594869.1 LemA family protein [Methanobacteriaceae archaeon]
MNDISRSLLYGFISLIIFLIFTSNLGYPNNWICSLIGAFIVIIAYLLFKGYNELINGRNSVDNSWAQIDVQLNRRMDLIPNLVETVKGYASHEKETLNEVTEARSGLKNADTVKSALNANNKLTETLNNLFMVAENYPDLKANTNFQDLQNQLNQIEGQIANYRENFNNKVLNYNNLCQQIPTNIVALLFNFKPINYFQISDEDRITPKIKF